MAKKYIVELTNDEKSELTQLLKGGEMGVRKVKRIQILLRANEGWADEIIAAAVGTGRSTVERTRKSFVLKGLEETLTRKKPHRIYERKLDGRAEAHLIALACSTPPEGRNKWTMQLLADKLVKLDEIDIESVSSETVRKTLKKMNFSLGENNSG